VVTAVRSIGGSVHTAALRGRAVHGGSVGNGRHIGGAAGEAACRDANRAPRRLHRGALRGGAPRFVSLGGAGGPAS
jgi:hypothetical protein